MVYKVMVNHDVEISFNFVAVKKLIYKNENIIKIINL